MAREIEVASVSNPSAHCTGPSRDLFYRTCPAEEPDAEKGSSGLGNHSERFTGNVRHLDLLCGTDTRKDPTKTVEDLKKAAWYLNRFIEKKRS